MNKISPGSGNAVIPGIADLLNAGRIRVAVYPPTYAKDPVTGLFSGWTIDVIGKLGERLGIESVAVEQPTPPDAVQCLLAGECDVAILGIEPARAAQVDFTPALVELDYTLLVPQHSSAQAFRDLDQAGVRIAAVRNHASTLSLERQLEHAQLVYAEMLDAAFDILRNGHADAFASVREIVLRSAEQLPGSRALDGRYGSNLIGMGVPKGQPERLAYFSAFVEEAKASGVVQQGLDRIAWRGARVAPASPH